MAKRTVCLVILGVPSRGRVADAPAEKAEEHRDLCGRSVRAAAREKLPHDPVEARQVPVFAQVEEEDLVQVVERRLRDHLGRDRLGPGLACLGDLALVQGAHPLHRLRPLEQPTAELPEERRRLIGRDDLDRLVNLDADTVLDAVEVVEEDLPQPGAGDDLLGE